MSAHDECKPCRRQRNELKPSIRASREQRMHFFSQRIRLSRRHSRPRRSSGCLCAFREDANKTPRNLFVGERAAESCECVSASCPSKETHAIFFHCSVFLSRSIRTHAVFVFFLGKERNLYSNRDLNPARRYRRSIIEN